MRKIAFALMLLLLIIPSALSIQNEEYADQITALIYEECKGTDIKLKENFFIRADGRDFITDVKWLYKIEVIKAIVEYISNAEPFANVLAPGVTANFRQGEITLNGESKQIDNIGTNIIICGGNHLDVNGEQYYWNSAPIPYIREEQYEPKYEPEKDKFGESKDVTGNLSEEAYLKNEKRTLLFGIFFALVFGVITNFGVTYLFASKLKEKKLKNSLKVSIKNVKENLRAPSNISSNDF